MTKDEFDQKFNSVYHDVLMHSYNPDAVKNVFLNQPMKTEKYPAKIFIANFFCCLLNSVKISFMLL